VTPSSNISEDYSELIKKANILAQEIQSLSSKYNADTQKALSKKQIHYSRESLTNLLREIDALLYNLSDVSYRPVEITLSRSYSIALFFAFKFVHQPRIALNKLDSSPFYGSGVYAIYYTGQSFGAYNPISGTETPIYVGKANPLDSYAETTMQQGMALYARLREHAKNISKTDLSLSDFEYRCATVQSGLQDAVEGFMIKLFRPIWNKEVGIAFGIGKHGDAAATRANRRSPWDTLHPGRKWAAATSKNQIEMTHIIKRIEKHFNETPPFVDMGTLLKKLSEG
jgi:hypothetical protein